MRRVGITYLLSTNARYIKVKASFCRAIAFVWCSDRNEWPASVKSIYSKRIGYQGRSDHIIKQVRNAVQTLRFDQQNDTENQLVSSHLLCTDSEGQVDEIRKMEQLLHSPVSA